MWKKGTSTITNLTNVAVVKLCEWVQEKSPSLNLEITLDLEDNDVAHLNPLTNVPIKYQLPTPYGFKDIAWTRFYRSRSLRQGQRSNQGHTMTLHTHTPYPMSLPSINFLHLMVSEI